MGLMGTPVWASNHSHHHRTIFAHQHLQGPPKALKDMLLYWKDGALRPNLCHLVFENLDYHAQVINWLYPDNKRDLIHEDYQDFSIH